MSEIEEIMANLAIWSVYRVDGVDQAAERNLVDGSGSWEERRRRLEGIGVEVLYI